MFSTSLFLACPFSCLNIAMIVWIARSVDATQAPTLALLAWLILLALLVSASGARLSSRHRPGCFIWVVAILCAGLMALVVLFAADQGAESDPGCTAAEPCDLSYGFGAGVIFLFAVPVFAGLALAGRAAHTFVSRVVRRRQP